MVRHSHAHGQCELSCTAGVMLNVRRSDRNANQVSKLTLHPIDAHQTVNDLLVKVKACVTVLSAHG